MIKLIVAVKSSQHYYPLKSYTCDDVKPVLPLTPTLTKWWWRVVFVVYVQFYCMQTTESPCTVSVYYFNFSYLLFMICRILWCQECCFYIWGRPLCDSRGALRTPETSNCHQMTCPDIWHYLTRGQVAARGQEAVPLSVHADDTLLLYRDPLIEP